MTCVKQLFFLPSLDTSIFHSSCTREIRLKLFNCNLQPSTQFLCKCRSWLQQCKKSNMNFDSFIGMLNMLNLANTEKLVALGYTSVGEE